jgi:hypothetical protein
MKPAPPPAPALEAPVVAAAPPQAAAAAPPLARAVVVAPRVVLSKFRQSEVASPGAPSNASKTEVGGDRSAELARIPIVRIRRETEKKVPFLARLLSSF